jgi:L-lactate dehydrogenase
VLADHVAEVLVAADMMGHRTHGLALLPTYLEELARGGMTISGDYRVERDVGAALFIDACRLPGAYVLRDILRKMVDRSAAHPVVTASIGNCFHIGALQPYLEIATGAGLLCLLTATDPAIASVAPFGGLDPVITSNPIAFGIPTSGDPILIDFCTSVISNAVVRTHLAAGQQLPGDWLIDGHGQPTRDPAAVTASPPGTILPIGGTDFGYKGFALGLMVEAMALALSGYGRTGDHRLFGEGVFVQVINPDYFSGTDFFKREMDGLAARSTGSRVPAGADRVRLPGERALASRASSVVRGIELPDDLAELLAGFRAG